VSVTVYVADGCFHSATLLEDLRRRHVAFTVVNLTVEPGRIAELVSLTWERRLPVIVDHERCSVGFGGQSTAFSDLGIVWPPARGR
jgi:glutaredoxin